jgi:peptidoglycan/LPS O-acetylase OafA/YrhL
VAAGKARQSLGEAFNPRANSLNLIRLVLAAAVACSHSLTIGGFRSEVLWGHGTVGDIAVDAFFAISGFLVTRSADRSGVTRYLWQRSLRIFPAFWACLAVTALAAVATAGAPAAGSAIRYIADNWTLDIRHYGIAGTPAGVPFPGAWDGSLWSLRWEFGCYLLVAALAATGLLRRRGVVPGLWAASWLAAIAVSRAGTRAFPPGAAGFIIRLVPVFLAGAAVWSLRRRLPASGLLLGGSLAAAAAGTFLAAPEVITGPTLAYAAICAATRLPGRRIGSRYDISYGAYLYGFPVAQVLAGEHAEAWGYLPFTGAVLALTAGLAWLSCAAVEQPALRLRQWPRGHQARHGVGRHRLGPAPGPGPISSDG